MNLKNAIFGGSVTGISDRSGAYDGSIQAWLPIKDIVQGVVVTRDKRFVKILELLPVNFYTMSSMDKSAAIWPHPLQVVSRMADEKCLLEDLQELVGCLYLSDLRLLCSRERVRQALKQLKAEDYPPAQWQDAAHYLMS